MYSCSHPKRYLVKTQSKQPGLLRRGGSKCRFCHHHRQCRHHQPVQASENRFTIHLNRSKCMRAVRIAGCWSSLLLRRGPRSVGCQEWHCADRQPISGLGCTRCDCNPCHRSPNTANIIRLRCYTYLKHNRLCSCVHPPRLASASVSTASATSACCTRLFLWM